MESYRINAFGVVSLISDRQKCFERALLIDPNYALAWLNLGHGCFRGDICVNHQALVPCLSSTVDTPRIFPKYDTFAEKALKRKGLSMRWNKKALKRKGYTRNECYEQFMKIVRNLAKDYDNNKKECCELILAVDFDNVHVWMELGKLGGGTIREMTVFSQQQCFDKAWEIDPAVAGVSAKGENDDAPKNTKVRCCFKINAWKKQHPMIKMFSTGFPKTARLFGEQY